LYIAQVGPVKHIPSRVDATFRPLLRRGRAVYVTAKVEAGTHLQRGCLVIADAARVGQPPSAVPDAVQAGQTKVSDGTPPVAIAIFAGVG
jgi:hypothetical protein